MPRQWLLGAVFALIVGVATHGQGLTTDAVAGEWVVAVERLGETQYQRMTLQVSGDQVTMVTPWPLEGVIRKDQIELRRGGDGEPIVMTGVLRPREMSGELTLSGVRGRWRATRPPERPSGASREHTFEPMQFHRVYSSAIPPGLRVHAGDTVKTSTVDASGLDAQGVRRSLTGNPLTGPFYVEGAMPGDTLVVKLTRLRLNRDTAFSGRRIANSAITTAYQVSQKSAETHRTDWVLDRRQGIARLAQPSDALKNFTVPLQPMLGSIGVAQYLTVVASGIQGAPAMEPRCSTGC